MVTLETLLYFSSLKLTLTDFLVYYIISQAKGPSTHSGILSCKNLNIKERQLRNILNKLEGFNLLSRFRNQHNQYYVLPYVFRKNIKRFYKFKSGNTLPIKTGNNHVIKLIKNARPAILCHNSYLYNNYIKLRKVNVRLNKNINNIKEEEFTFNYNEYKRNVVVTKENYNKIKKIKAQFKRDFPNKNSYIVQALPENFDYKLLRTKINNSEFLKNKNTLGLNWFIKNYDKVVNNFYTSVTDCFDKISQTDFSQRTYSKEFLDSLFDDLEVC